MESVFSGIRVVDLSQGMAGAMAAMVLADNGAEVVKVEPPDGDWARQVPGVSHVESGETERGPRSPRELGCRTQSAADRP